MASGRWKLLRQRFGIAAPRVEVQTQIPWYWRWAGIAVLLGVAAAAASWIYDAGRRFAGFDRSEVLQELQRAQGELEAARAELERLRAIADAADSRVSIERTAQQKLAQQVRSLEQENARVREDSRLEHAHSEERNPTLHLQFKVEPDAAGEYRYRLLLTPTDRRGATSAGAGWSAQEGERYDVLSGAGETGRHSGWFSYSRVEGLSGSEGEGGEVQVRVYETGSNQPRATHSVTL
jgi:hypothetical protein